MSDPPTARCPECGEPGQRVITGGTGLLFKGSGFYTTDYRTATYKEAEKKEKDAGAGSKPASDPPKKGKTEAKEGKS